MTKISAYLNKFFFFFLSLVLLLASSCNTNEVFSNLKQGSYYIGKVNGKDYVAQISTIDKNTIQGEFYVVGTQSVIEPVAFSAKMKKNKCVISFLDKKVTIKDLACTVSNTEVSGEGKVGKDIFRFQFSTYTTADYKTFKKRYQEPVYQYDVIKDVTYGHAEGYWVSNSTTSDNYLEIIKNGISSSIASSDLDLKMDLYLPKNDYMKQRPLLMFIHGGGFYIGDKADAPIVRWCKYYASLGYVVASINYRMGFKPAKQSIERCGYRAAQDANAAMRFLLANKDKYGINPDYLFAAGSSAGGITTLNLAFMRNKNRPESSYGTWLLPDLGKVDNSGNNISQSFHIRAIANMWGAVHDITEIENSNTAIISFHGDADQVVPYDYDVPFKDIELGVSKLFFEKMYGSAAIHRKAKQLGYRQELHTFPGAGHAPHVDKNDNPTEKFWFIQKEMTDFFFKEFIPHEITILTPRPQYYTIIVNNPSQVYWKAEGGIILSSNINAAHVVWLKNSPKHVLYVSGYLENGATFTASLNQ